MRILLYKNEHLFAAMYVDFFASPAAKQHIFSVLFQIRNLIMTYVLKMGVEILPLITELSLDQSTFIA